MDILATIISNDDSERIGLGIVKVNGKYEIHTEDGENAGLYAFATLDEAISAIGKMWGGWPWDLQWI